MNFQEFNNGLKKGTALYFVVLLGFVSLFADMTYEGARSISGQYMSLLGANAFIVAAVAGLGELTGYAVRFFSGYLSDRTGKYWPITIVGYVLNLAAVPLLALTSYWPAAAGLMILERFGKAIRSPARDAMLSYATKEMGRGWGFGLHMAMDQIGAIFGPLFVTIALIYNATYSYCFAMLAIPAFFALNTLGVARMLYPKPHELEKVHESIQPEGLSKSYWLYVGAVSLVAAGYADFTFIAFHFEKNNIVPPHWIPIFYAIAMGSSGLAALLFGSQYDKKGISVLYITTLISSIFAPLVFFGGFYLSLIGMIIWGIGMGTQASIMRAVVANLVRVNKRGTAYGILNASFGIFWFVGSLIMGLLYDHFMPVLVAFSVLSQLAAIPLFYSAKHR